MSDLENPDFKLAITFMSRLKPTIDNDYPPGSRTSGDFHFRAFSNFNYPSVFQSSSLPSVYHKNISANFGVLLNY